MHIAHCPVLCLCFCGTHTHTHIQANEKIKTAFAFYYSHLFPIEWEQFAECTITYLMFTSHEKAIFFFVFDFSI